MAHKFSEGQRVRVLEDAHLEDSVEQYRGRAGVVDHIAESSPELIFYSVAFDGSWDRGYIREEALEAVDEEEPPLEGHGCFQITPAVQMSSVP